MSLYNMLNGMNPIAGKLLSMIGIEPNSIPRFRDAWISKNFETITILTRTGGNNRGEYFLENAKMAENPNYLSDEDDDFDSTFAKFNYRVPEDQKSLFSKEMEAAALTPEEKSEVIETITETNTQKWDKTMRALKEMKS